MERSSDGISAQLTEHDRLVWKENERGLHLSIEVLDDTYSATGVTIQSVLEVMVLELADTLEEHLASSSTGHESDS